MGVRINTNIEALNAQRNLGATATAFSKSVEKLSSGLRINRAADDAAGLAISEKLRAQVRGLNQALRNAQDGISMIQTAEGALNAVQNMLQRVRELAVQSSNSTLSAGDLTSVNTEIQALRAEIDRISGATEFNGQKLLNGTLVGSLGGATATDLVVGDQLATTAVAAVTKIEVEGAKAQTYTFSGSGTSLTLTGADGAAQTITVGAAAANGTSVLNFGNLGIRITIQANASGKAAADIVTDLTAAADDTIIVSGSAANFQIGANASDFLTVSFTKMDVAGLGLTTALNNFGTTQSVANAQALITALDTSGQGLARVSTERGAFGAVQNRLEQTIANLGVAAENLAASESRVRDLDVAAEMVSFTKTQILQQAGTAILAQANSAPQSVLSLLR
ncbi:MAG: flagellin [Anaerolinea sp.]|jgi:flagellin|nr:flagellin [Anaerolinea sp.]